MSEPGTGPAAGAASPTGTAAPTGVAAAAPEADGRAAGYRSGGTLSVRTELRRQLTRRRTQISLGFLVLLPFLLALAFTFGDSSSSTTGGFVDLATSGGLNFTVFTLFVSTGFLLVVVVSLFFGDSVASEASWSSLRYLLAMPVPRARLLRQKALVAGLVSVFGLVLLPAVALALGTAVYGANPVLNPVGEALGYGQGVLRLVMIVVFVALQLSWVAGLAMAMSVLTDAPLGAVGGAVMITILSQILDAIPALGDLRNWLPTHYADAWTALLSVDVDWDQMVRGTFSSLAYATVFGLVAWRRFATKDITS